jgi:hypothetical protein
MDFNRSELTELLNLLKTDNRLKLSEELEDQIADHWGVLNDNNNQIDWLQFIINTYAS